MLKESTRRRLHDGVHVVPTLVSLGNFLCGLASIACALKASSLLVTTPAGGYALPPEWGHLIYVAAMLICFAMVCDLLDGRIARMTGSDSPFGAEIDSLADVVSFGIAPAVLVGALAPAMPFAAKYVWVPAAAYATFAAMRLARYNVEKGVQHPLRFSGLPSPAAAGAVVSLVMLYTVLRFGEHRDLAVAKYASQLIKGLPLYMLLLGLLMVSRVRYSHLSRKVLSGHKPFRHVVALVLVIAFAWMELEFTLAAGFTLYVAYSIAVYLYAKLVRREVADDEAETETEDTAPDRP